eukprot:15249447-Alexandrium_andersonii.AAC.1
MRIQAPQVLREEWRLQRLAMEIGGNGFRRFRAAERASRPVGRARAAASSCWDWGRLANFGKRPQRACGCSDACALDIGAPQQPGALD